MSSSRLRRLFAAVALAIPLAAAPAAAQAEAHAAPPQPLTVYQMNLCNSGSAPCFQLKRDYYGADGSGLRDETIAARTMEQAVVQIQSLKTPPDIITLNEICEQDLNGLKQVLAYHGDSFFPVMSSDGDALPCEPTRGSTRYGSAILTKDPMPTPWSEHRLFHEFTEDNQDPGVTERRSMGCRKMTGFTACTGQLLNLDDHTDPDDPARPYTEAQCKELVGEAETFADGQPLIIAGDLNLRWTDDSPDDQQSLQNCLDESENGNLTRKSDGDVQHVITTMDFADVGVKESPEWFTDHPALWAKLQ